eukprot:10400379-Alexandrium_andersonii.AAC.1
MSMLGAACRWLKRRPTPQVALATGSGGVVAGASACLEALRDWSAPLLTHQGKEPARVRVAAYA